MFRPERMVSTSIFCVSRDVDLTLEALSRFGEFQVEQAAEPQSLAAYNQSIQEATDTLSHVNYLTQQLTFTKASFTDIFKMEVQPAKTVVTSENWKTLQESTRQQILGLKKDVDALTTELDSLKEQTKRANNLQQMFTLLKAMDFDLSLMKDLKAIYIDVGAIPHENFAPLEVALSSIPTIIQRHHLTKDFDFLSFAMTSKHRPEVEKILKIHHCEIFQFPTDLPFNVDLALKEINKQLEEAEEKEKQLQSQFKKLGRENRQNLAVWGETTANILAMLQAKRKILQSGRLAVVKGFVPKDAFAELTQKISTELNGKALVLQNGVAAGDDPPTKVKHNRFVRPFEEITKLYGLPHYDEIDPTPILAVTFPLIFGLMFGDMGHGLLLLVGGLTVGFLIKKNQAIKNICWILAACGFGAVVAGALFGEFFGIQLFKPLWFSPFENVLTFLIFSLVLGVVQIISGFALEVTNFVIKRNYVDAVLTSLPKIGFYLGGVYLVVAYQLNFGAWLSGPILFVLVPFFLLVFAKPAYVAAAHVGEGKDVHGEHLYGEHVVLSERLFESGDLVTRLLSNTMSYSRILALLMAHWALILVVYTIAGLVGGSASILTLILSGIIVVGGNIFVIALEGLIVFIHTMRLHFYEWFSKFYLGTGTPFMPFEQKYVYTNIDLTKNKPKQ